MSSDVIIDGYRRSSPIVPEQLSEAHVPHPWALRGEERTTRYMGPGTGKAEKLGWKSYLKKQCSLSSIRQRIPLSIWIVRYSLLDLKGDVIAGITVGLTTVPQALAYAQIADLPSEYGIYSSFMACFAYALFGTSKDVTLGVTAVISLLTAECIPHEVNMEERILYATLLAFLVGIIQIALGVFQLGFLFSFVSHPVLSGFTTASAFIIMFSQLKNLLGIQGGHTTDTVIQQGGHYINNITQVRGWDILMGMMCMSCLLLLRQIKLPKPSRIGPTLHECLRIIVAARYGIVVVFAATVAYLLEYFNWRVLTLTADVEAALPLPALPDLAWNNVTFVAHFRTLAPGLPFVAIISALETIAIAKAFGSKFSYPVDATQELISIGMANFLTSFVRGYPVAGSFTKSSLNAQSGVRTPMGGVVTGLFVIVAQLVAAQAFQYVPKAALGAVILVAVIMLIDIKIIRELWTTNRSELIPLGGTVICSFFLGVDLGFLVGIGLSFALVLYGMTEPRLQLDCGTRYYSNEKDPNLSRKIVNIRVKPEGRMFFPAHEHFKRYLADETFLSQKPRRRSLFEPALLHLSSVQETNGSPGKVDPSSQLLPLTPELTRITKETAVFYGDDLAKLDFTSLYCLHSVISKYHDTGYAVYFVDTSVNTLKVILPKEQQKLLPLEKKSGDLVTILISPLSWRGYDRSRSVPVVNYVATEDNDKEENHPILE